MKRGERLPAEKMLTVPLPPPGVIHAPAASQTCVPFPPAGQVTTCELALLEPVHSVPPFSVKPGAATGTVKVFAVEVRHSSHVLLEYPKTVPM